MGFVMVVVFLDGWVINGIRVSIKFIMSYRYKKVNKLYYIKEIGLLRNKFLDFIEILIDNL